MLEIFRHKRIEGCSKGVGDKLAELWKALILKVMSFVGVDDRPDERGSIEHPDLDEDDSFDDGKASIASLSTLHGKRSSRRRADVTPESPLPTATAEFD